MTTAPVAAPAAAAAAAGGLRTIVIDPVSPHKYTCIFLHGLGDTGDGWAAIAPKFQSKGLQSTKFIFPTAPRMAVTLNGGMRMTAWHDILSLENVSNENFAGIEASRKLIEDLIDKEIASGIPAANIILGGFSQGAALALFTGLQFRDTLAGICALSGYLPHHQTFKSLATPNGLKTSTFIAHGTADQVVLYEFGTESNRCLRGLGVPTEFHSYKLMGHSSSPEEMDDLFAFIRKRFV